MYCRCILSAYLNADVIIILQFLDARDEHSSCWHNHRHLPGTCQPSISMSQFIVHIQLKRLHSIQITIQKNDTSECNHHKFILTAFIVVSLVHGLSYWNVTIIMQLKMYSDKQEMQTVAFSVYFILFCLYIVFHTISTTRLNNIFLIYDYKCIDWNAGSYAIHMKFTKNVYKKFSSKTCYLQQVYLYQCHIHVTLTFKVTIYVWHCSPKSIVPNDYTYILEIIYW